MPSTRISMPTREVLRKLAEESGESMQAIVEKAVELYRHQHFLEECNRAFEALQTNPELWKVEQDERDTWNIALSDDLEKA